MRHWKSLMLGALAMTSLTLGCDDDDSDPAATGGTPAGGTETPSGGDQPPVGGQVNPGGQDGEPVGTVGTACAQDADCGEGASCLTEADGYPAGLCVINGCEQTGCPSDSSCFRNGSDTTCFPTCSEHTDCREGYICKNGAVCQPGLRPQVGPACRRDADCGVGATCLTDGYPDGMCVVNGCGETGCPDADSRCFRNGDDTTCFPLCSGHSDCRDGYYCKNETVCVPGLRPQVGTTCARDADCGVGATCLTAAEGYPNGMCVVYDCAESGCPDGAHCYRQDDRTICLPVCDEDSDCRSGYECRGGAACQPDGTTPDPDPEDSPVGTACQQDSDCGSGRCAGPDEGFPNGYCLLSCSDQAPCPGDNNCYRFRDGNSYCLDTCQANSDCRTGYLCDTDKTCWPDDGTAPTGAVHGTLLYQLRTAEWNEQGQIGLSDPTTSGAPLVFFQLEDATGEILATGTTDNQGRFAADPSQAPRGDMTVYFATILTDVESGYTALGVLKPDSAGEPDSLNSPPWVWSAPVGDDGDVGTVTITEAQGSGAIFIYLMNLVGMSSVINDVLGGDTSTLSSLGILWKPGEPWSCGACFWAGPQRSGQTEYENSVFIGGEYDGSSAWGWPVHLHEFGHYVAARYSRDDSPGGTHSLGETIAPAFAWSEGWASFFAIRTMSAWQGAPSPLFWDIQEGYSFWIDYENMEVEGQSMVMPRANAGISQDLDETYVTSVVWHLWDGDEVPEAELNDGVALGTSRILSAIASSRFLYGDRGARGVDLVDFVDAVVCAENALLNSVTQALTNRLHFPYDGSPTCR